MWLFSYRCGQSHSLYTHAFISRVYKQKHPKKFWKKYTLFHIVTFFLGMVKVILYTHCDFISGVQAKHSTNFEKYILWLFFLWLFFLWLFFLWLFFLFVLWLFILWFFFLWLFFRLPSSILDFAGGYKGLYGCAAQTGLFFSGKKIWKALCIQ